MLGFLQRQFLPVGLLAAAVVGFFFPRPGLYMAELPTQYVAVSIIFFLSGLMLKTDEVHAALAAWKATSWGCVSILFATPFLGAVIAFQLPMEPAFQFGLALFCCMPTTLTSGVALTAQARGNVALALLLTVLTNIVGIFTVPFVLAHLLSSLGQVELSAGDLFAKLCLSILLPLGVGKYLRRFAVDWINAQRSRLTLASNAALISIPWMKFSESSGQLAQVEPMSLLILVLSGLSNPRALPAAQRRRLRAVATRSGGAQGRCADGQPEDLAGGDDGAGLFAGVGGVARAEGFDSNTLYCVSPRADFRGRSYCYSVGNEKRLRSGRIGSAAMSGITASLLNDI